MLSNPDEPTTVDHMSPTAAVLDNVVFTSLTGPHGRLAQRHGRAVRYPAEVSGFAALPDQPRQQDWSDLAQLADTARGVAVAGLGGEVPEGWNTLSRLIVIQMVDDGVDSRPDAEVVRLTSSDVPEMLDLVAQTQAGPLRAAHHRDGHLPGIPIGRPFDRHGGGTIPPPRVDRDQRRVHGARGPWPRVGDATRPCGCIRDPAAGRDAVLACRRIECQGHCAVRGVGLQAAPEGRSGGHPALGLRTSRTSPAGLRP